MTDFEHFHQPSITVLSGHSGCGKTSTIRDILCKNLIPRIDTVILMCEYPEENIYSEITGLVMLKNPNAKITLTPSKNLEAVIRELSPSKCNLLIVDDQLSSSDFNLSKLAGVESRHKNCTTFMITQNIFSDTKNFLHFKRQVRYFILFNDGDHAGYRRFINSKFPNMGKINLPVSKMYIIDTIAKKLYDDQWKEINP